MLILAAVFALVALASLLLGLLRLTGCRGNFLDPTVAFWFGFAIYYGVGNVWFCWQVASAGYLQVSSLVFDSAIGADLDALLLVAGLTAAYGAAVALGMFFIGPRVVPPVFTGMARRVAGGPDPSVWLLLPLCIVSWIAQLGMVADIATSLPHGILMIPHVCCLAINAKVCHMATQSRSWHSIAIALSIAIPSVIAGAATGMKEAMLTPILAGGAGFMMAYRRPWPIIAAIALALPAFVVLQAWNTVSRTVIWDETRALSPTERVSEIGQVTTDALSAPDDLLTGSEISRLCTAVPMLQTLELLHHDNGIAIQDGLLIPLVPRAIWPDKPSIKIGATLYERFTGHEGSSSSPGQPAEAYMYGGWVGVVAIGVGIGVLAVVGSTFLRELWDADKAASVGAVLPLAVMFLKCENLVYGYLPALLNCLVVLLVIRSVSMPLLKTDVVSSQSLSRP
jgi:hypothetical protein